tara:strand:- start:231 stop:425 length:195 start_codon:yes stop_codon:yes gene_type:complete
MYNGKLNNIKNVKNNNIVGIQLNICKPRLQNTNVIKENIINNVILINILYDLLLFVLLTTCKYL